MKTITIYEYIATNVPNDASILINQFGGSYRKARDVKELESQLKHFVKTNGSKGLMALANIHPDKELIQQTLEENAGGAIKEKLPFSNATGDAGNNNIPNLTQESINLSRMMIYGSFLLIGLALVMKK